MRQNTLKKGKIQQTVNPIHNLSVLNLLSLKRNQPQFSLNSIHTSSREKIRRTEKWSPKGECFDLLSHSPNYSFKEMYAGLSGEFVCGYWCLTF